MIFSDYVRWLYIVIDIAAVYIAKDRNTYLPFLGQTALPCSVMPKQGLVQPTHKLSLTTKPNTKIVYWAAKLGQDYTQHAMQAYEVPNLEVPNSGVAMSDKTGKAELRFKDPQGYYVDHWGIKKYIPRHIHYRECQGNLMVGPVQTIKL